MPTKKKLTEIRIRQRVHAKRRFEQRFNLVLNRDQIHEIEKKIDGNQAICIEAKKRNLKNFFVEVEGKIIAVGYDSSTHRVVTALPDGYLAELPPEIVAAAHLLLLPAEAQHIISEILDGRAEQIYRRNENVRFYRVQHMGGSVKIGYNKTKCKLVPYASTASPLNSVASRTVNFGPHSQELPVLSVDPEIFEEFSRQIRSMESKFLWRYSKSLTFHEVLWNGQPYRVGYVTGYGRLYAYLNLPNGYSYGSGGGGFVPHPPENELA